MVDAGEPDNKQTSEVVRHRIRESVRRESKDGESSVVSQQGGLFLEPHQHRVWKSLGFGWADYGYVASGVSHDWPDLNDYYNQTWIEVQCRKFQTATQ